MGFVVEYAIGGAAVTSLPTVAGYMFTTHVLIGVGEGLITAVTVMAVARARPDLVYLLRRSRVEAAA
jgi:cobalt/nickel transport system permease protein